jgi:hypothetical protein
MSILNQVLEATTNTTAELPEVTTDSGWYKTHQFFEVEEHSISGPYGRLPGKKGLFVNEKNINIVSDNYACHQPIEIAKTFQRVSESHGMEINAVMPNPHNGGLMMSAKYAGMNVGGDKTDVNLTFYTSHDGKSKTFLSLDTLRIACFNQLPALYRNKSRFIFAEKHYKNALDVNLIGEALANIPDSINAHNDKLNTLRDTKLSLDDFLEMWKEHYKLKEEQKQFQSKIDKMKAIYRNAPGQELCPTDSAYKALQAVTYANTHEGRNTSMKIENSIIKGGNDSLVFLEELLEVAH